jgi:hypothetical protein
VVAAHALSWSKPKPKRPEKKSPIGKLNSWGSSQNSDTDKQKKNFQDTE